MSKTVESPSGPVVVAVDLGGTNLRMAAVDFNLRIVARRQEATESDPEADAVIQRIASAVAQMRTELPRCSIVGLAIGAPGPADPILGTILQAPHLPRWHNVPLAERLRQATGLPVVLDNDANLAALGEAWLGAGRGARNMVYLTVSTGVGSGVIVDGALLRGEHGVAAEAGHMTIYVDGRPCPCGNRGCLEAYASGTALAERAREAIAAGRVSILERPESIDAIAISEAALLGDPLAKELIADAGTALGLGIQSLLHIFDPSLVVIGGGVSQIGANLWDPMRAVVDADALATYPTHVRIVPAELGDDSGLMGAAILARERFAADGAEPNVEAGASFRSQL